MNSKAKWLKHCMGFITHLHCITWVSFSLTAYSGVFWLSLQRFLLQRFLLHRFPLHGFHPSVILHYMGFFFFDCLIRGFPVIFAQVSFTPFFLQRFLLQRFLQQQCWSQTKNIAYITGREIK